ncbi:type 1 glutamine amidotransferase [Piscinibacter sp. XHJ-5]|uniref:gamma-glutamyl-gamma-aminobutyrate hydrolase family protein n=1 Tax=Piscinibacter sp. XHJ-5 TaxID=3037797 RepID=UPI00245316DD|nr:type 1 glutamine amidotransferase [Piscinibacter sp. XHJ-5]
MDERLKIGISACFFHADPARPIFTGKTLQYIEQSVAHWVMSSGALAVMIPDPEGDTRRGDATLAHYARWLDGLVLEGGSDVWPGSYGETPLQERWSGDRVRDDYEKALAAAFIAECKPVFGVCRGLQLLNVAFGGTLYQDIATQRPDAASHREASLYDRHFHEIEFVPGSRLAQMYAGVARARVNSVHHQAIKDLASGFVVEARSVGDGLIEAVRRPGDSYVAAVQWHPEFHRADWGTLDDAAILDDFLGAVQASKER